MSSVVLHPPLLKTTGWNMTIGPPGTGKTATLLYWFKEELVAGTPPAMIAFVTFTRAARLEALQRACCIPGLNKNNLPWVRTIHATAYRLLDLHRKQIMTNSYWKEFAKKHNYKLTDLHDPDDEGQDAPLEPPRRTADDKMRYLYEWGRNRRLDVEKSLSKSPINVPVLHFRLFVRRLEDFKKQRELLDFTDMLDQVIEKGLRPDVDVAFIDEAQDLSPLQIAVVEQWFAPCKRVYVGGDDDQAIYSFQGAEPDWLLGLAGHCPTTILDQSYRVPASVYAIAQKIIGWNHHRVPKRYQPTSVPGEVLRLSAEQALVLIDGNTDTLVLARNRMFLRPFASRLFERRLPYIVEGVGGLSPLSSTSAVAAVRAANHLAHCEDVDAAELSALLAYIPSRGSEHAPRGVKARVKERTEAIPFAEVHDCLGLGTLLDAIRNGGPASVLIKLPPIYRAYFQALLDQYGDVPPPRVRLTSIHGAKGREADLVIVLPDMTRATYAEYLDSRRGGSESENRVAYVAVTRSKRCLILVQPSTRRHYHFPSDPQRPYHSKEVENE